MGNVNAIRVSYQGQEYPSIKAASRALRMSKERVAKVCTLLPPDKPSGNTMLDQALAVERLSDGVRLARTERDKQRRRLVLLKARWHFLYIHGKTVSEVIKSNDSDTLSIAAD